MELNKSSMQHHYEIIFYSKLDTLVPRRQNVAGSESKRGREVKPKHTPDDAGLEEMR